MSYDIFIGELVASTDEDDYMECRVRRETRADAPAFPGDDMSHHRNGRHPAYSAWRDFCLDTGLYGLFFDRENGLMRDHPGLKPLTHDHYHELQNKIAQYRTRHPRSTVENDYDMVRLLWLEWWFRWALENCHYPALENY